ADGGGTTTTLVPMLQQPSDLRLLDQGLLWANVGIYTMQGSLELLTPGGSAMTIETGDNPFVVVADATSFYYLGNPQNGSTQGDLLRRARSGGASEKIYSSGASPRQLAIDDDYVYLAESGLDVSQGAVYRFAKSSGEKQTVASGLTYTNRLAVDA